MIASDKAVIPLAPSVDHSAKEGFFVTLTNGQAVLATDATSVLPIGVIITGYTTGTLPDDIATWAFRGIVKVALSATPGVVLAGSSLVLDGTTLGAVKLDPASGGRVIVGVALEASSTGGDLINAILSKPVIGT